MNLPAVFESHFGLNLGSQIPDDCLFVCYRVSILMWATRNTPSRCLTIQNRICNYSQSLVTSSLCAIEKHFWSLEERLCSDGSLRNWAPFRVVVPGGCPRTITSLLLDAVLNTRWYLIWREIGRIQIFNFKLKADLSEEILNCHIVLVLVLMLTFASILKPTEARKSQKKYSKFRTKTMTMSIQNLFRLSSL